MKKRKNYKIIKAALVLIMALCVTMGIGMGAFAEEVAENPENIRSGGENIEETPDFEANGEEKGEDLPSPVPESGANEKNIFAEIYAAVEKNADKIFSILAFVGTIIVSIGYKSGLIPLLNDALSKLKGSLDGVRESGEKLNADTSVKIAEMDSSLRALEKNVNHISTHLEGYEALTVERGAMRKILEGQIDMLYAIFMSSALPQYQKDEIGEKIQSMREELASYEEFCE